MALTSRGAAERLCRTFSLTPERMRRYLGTAGISDTSTERREQSVRTLRCSREATFSSLLHDG